MFNFLFLIFLTIFAPLTIIYKVKEEMRVTLPAEWEEQEMVQLTWPHEGTDWAPMLREITATYVQMARAIAERETLLIVAPDTNGVRQLLSAELSERQMANIIFHRCPTNDTWARDHAFLTLSDGTLLDFCFNGWGEKFEASLDNAINRSLVKGNQNSQFSILNSQFSILNSQFYESHLDFVLEGGSIESDGRGTVYTTRCCLLAPHRNQPLTEAQIEEELKRRLRADRIVWLDDEPLPGDDTDGHIDTLARILPDGTLLRLPLPDPIYDEDGSQLPATYANYLIINGAVLVPTYGQPENDRRAIERIREAFPDREMIPIDARPIIRQHGSVHCCAMQYPKVKK